MANDSDEGLDLVKRVTVTKSGLTASPGAMAVVTVASGYEITAYAPFAEGADPSARAIELALQKLGELEAYRQSFASACVEEPTAQLLLPL